MVLTNLEASQRYWIIGNKAFPAEQQQHNHEMLQRHHHPTVYSDLNLFNPPANVNIVKPQPPNESLTRVSQISSNGYYGFVQCFDENVAGAIDNENTTEEASMDTEEVPYNITRKRGFEIEQPQFVDQMHAAKKCRLDYEDGQMATDDDTMFNATVTESLRAATNVAPPASELPPPLFTDNSEILYHHNEHKQLKNMRPTDEQFLDNQTTQPTLNEDVESLWWHTHGAVMHQMTNFVEF